MRTYTTPPAITCITIDKQHGLGIAGTMCGVFCWNLRTGAYLPRQLADQPLQCLSHPTITKALGKRQFDVLHIRSISVECGWIAAGTQSGTVVVWRIWPVYSPADEYFAIQDVIDGSEVFNPLTDISQGMQFDEPADDDEPSTVCDRRPLLAKPPALFSNASEPRREPFVITFKFEPWDKYEMKHEGRKAGTLAAPLRRPADSKAVFQTPVTVVIVQTTPPDPQSVKPGRQPADVSSVNVLSCDAAGRVLKWEVAVSRLSLKRNCIRCWTE